MRAVSLSDAPVTNLHQGPEIGHVTVHDFFGRGKRVEAGPQAYLGEQCDHGSTIYPHFHDVDQFQIVVKGAGAFGKHKVAPVTIQYADAFSPYGPIIAGETGVGYFTLRRCAAGGGWKMPGNRHRIPGKPGRRFFVHLDDYVTRPGQGLIDEEIVWGPAEDGLSVRVLRMGANSAIAVKPDPESGGHYILVCAGMIKSEGRAMPECALLLQEPGDPSESLDAGPDGAVILVMTFAAPSERPGSDPRKLVRDGQAYERPGAGA